MCFYSVPLQNIQCGESQCRESMENVTNWTLSYRALSWKMLYQVISVSCFSSIVVFFFLKSECSKKKIMFLYI